MIKALRTAAVVIFGAFPACAQGLPWPGPGMPASASGCPSAPTFTLVGHAAIANSNTTPATNCASTNIQVVVRTWFDGTGSPAAPADTSGTNTYTQIGSTVDMGDNTKLDLWYLATTSGTASWQWGYVGGVTGGFPAFAGACFRASSGTPALDQHNQAGASNQPGSVTPTANGALLVTGYVPDDTVSGSTLTINSGFSITDQASHGAAEGIGVAYLVQTACAAINPTWTVSNGTKVGAANIGTFK